MEKELQQISEEFAGVYNVLSDDKIRPDHLEVGAVDNSEDEASVWLPSLDINIQDWRTWSPEKKLEVYIHEYAHTVNYSDDHQISFWERVAQNTLEAANDIEELEEIFGEEFDKEQFKSQVVESVHEGVIEPGMDSERVKDYLEEFFFLEKEEYCGMD